MDRGDAQYSGSKIGPDIPQTPPVAPAEKQAMEGQKPANDTRDSDAGADRDPETQRKIDELVSNRPRNMPELNDRMNGDQNGEKRTQPVTHIGEGPVGEPRTTTKDALDYFVNVSNAVTEWNGMSDADRQRVNEKWDHFIDSRLDNEEIFSYAKDYPELGRHLLRRQRELAEINRNKRNNKASEGPDETSKVAPSENSTATGTKKDGEAIDENPDTQKQATADTESKPDTDKTSASDTKPKSEGEASPSTDDKPSEGANSAGDEKKDSEKDKADGGEKSASNQPWTADSPRAKKYANIPGTKPNFGQFDDVSYGERGPGDEHMSEEDLIARRNARLGEGTDDGELTDTREGWLKRTLWPFGKRQAKTEESTNDSKASDKQKTQEEERKAKQAAEPEWMRKQREEREAVAATPTAEGDKSSGDLEKLPDVRETRGEDLDEDRELFNQHRELIKQKTEQLDSEQEKSELIKQEMERFVRENSERSKRLGKLYESNPEEYKAYGAIYRALNRLDSKAEQKEDSSTASDDEGKDKIDQGKTEDKTSGKPKTPEEERKAKQSAEPEWMRKQREEREAQEATGTAPGSENKDPKARPAWMDEKKDDGDSDPTSEEGDKASSDTAEGSDPAITSSESVQEEDSIDTYKAQIRELWKGLSEEDKQTVDPTGTGRLAELNGDVDKLVSEKMDWYKNQGVDADVAQRRVKNDLANYRMNMVTSLGEDEANRALRAAGMSQLEEVLYDPDFITHKWVGDSESGYTLEPEDWSKQVGKEAGYLRALWESYTPEQRADLRNVDDSLSDVDTFLKVKRDELARKMDPKDIDKELARELLEQRELAVSTLGIDRARQILEEYRNKRRAGFDKNTSTASEENGSSPNTEEDTLSSEPADQSGSSGGRNVLGRVRDTAAVGRAFVRAARAEKNRS